MPALTTPRLYLLPLSRTMIQTRLERDDFDLPCLTPEGEVVIHFPPAWPGAPLGFFPHLLNEMGSGRQEFTVVTWESRQAIGQIGTKGTPNAAGELEIGYGLNPSAWGQGYATEAVGALIQHLLTLPDVQVITAQTALSNHASERVLEKLGFRRTGASWDDEDGDLTVWAYREA